MFFTPLQKALAHSRSIRAKRPGKRPQGTLWTRQLHCEPLEDRRLLASTLSIDDVTVTEGDDTGVFVDIFTPAPGIAGALEGPNDIVIGPDGNLYVPSAKSNEVLRYDPTTGVLIDVFVSAGPNAPDGTTGIAFGSDGALYVGSHNNHKILRYDGITGTYIDTVVSGGSLVRPMDLLFAPDDTLYVCSRDSDEVLRYDMTTGALLNVVISASDGLDNPTKLLLHDGSLFVTSYLNHKILRYDGQTVDIFVSSGSGGLLNPNGMSYGPDGNFYVNSCFSHQVLRYDGTSGAFIDEFIDKLEGCLFYGVDIMFVPGRMYVTSWANNSIAIHDPHTGDYIDTLVVSPRPRAPKGLEFGTDGSLYVSNWNGASVTRYDGQSGNLIEYFVDPFSGGINFSHDLHFGPDGNLYVASMDKHSVYRYDGTTGDYLDMFIPPQDGLNFPSSFIFRTDGKFYLSCLGSNNVLRFDSSSGQFIDEFIAPQSGGLDGADGMVFAPDGNLLVVSKDSGKILRYNGTTGAFMNVFADIGLLGTGYLVFGPDENLYVSRNNNSSVVRYDGATGEYIDDFVPSGLGGLFWPSFMAFDPNGALYVSNQGPTDGGYVMRYAPASHAAFTVTLAEPSETVVTVDYATSGGTANAGSDFKAISGTLTFEPGVTSRKIVVQTIDDIILEDNETFSINLSNPTGGAALVDPQGVSIIIDNDGLLFSDSFEVGEWNDLWIEDSQNDWFTSTQRATAGNYSAEVDGRATDATLTIADPVDLTPYGCAELTFDWYIESGLDTGEYLALDLFNGATWQEVARLSGNVDQENTWHQEIVEIGSNYLVSDFQLRFRAKMNKSDEDANVDNVRLVATSLANQPPTSGDDSASTIEDTSVPITKADLLLNDADPENDTLSITGFGEPGNGTLVDNGATITYTPNTDFNGIDTFTYTVTDGNGGNDTATVDVTITGVADPPVADAGGPYTVVEGAMVTLDASGTTDPDLPYGDALTYAWDYDNDGVFDDANGVAPTFDAGGINVGTVVPVALRVTDVTSTVSTSETTVTVETVPSELVYTSVGDPINIGDNKTASSSINISGTGATIASLTVRIDLIHALPSDLTAQLVSSTGEILDITGPIVSGDYGHEYIVTVPTNQILDGTWTLQVSDNLKNRKRGKLFEWTMSVEPTPIESALSPSAAIDQALMAWVESELSDDDNSDIRTQTLAHETALMLV